MISATGVPDKNAWVAPPFLNEWKVYLTSSIPRRVIPPLKIRSSCLYDSPKRGSGGDLDSAYRNRPRRILECDIVMNLFIPFFALQIATPATEEEWSRRRTSPGKDMPERVTAKSSEASRSEVKGRPIVSATSGCTSWHSRFKRASDTIIGTGGGIATKSDCPNLVSYDQRKFGFAKAPGLGKRSLRRTCGIVEGSLVADCRHTTRHRSQIGLHRAGRR